MRHPQLVLVRMWQGNVGLSDSYVKESWNQNISAAATCPDMEFDVIESAPCCMTSPYFK